jgi:hypothetical protein
VSSRVVIKSSLSDPGCALKEVLWTVQDPFYGYLVCANTRENRLESFGLPRPRNLVSGSAGALFYSMSGPVNWL